MATRRQRGPASAEKTLEPMSRKDILTIIISASALCLSVGSFVSGQWEKSKDSKTVIRKQSFAAFELGKRFASSFWLYVLTQNGDAEKIAKTKEKALELLRTAELYATQLDLRIDLEELTVKYNYKDGGPLEDAYSVIATRLVSTVGQSVSDKFSVAYWLTFLNFVGQAAYKKGANEFMQFKNDYAKKSAPINIELNNIHSKFLISTTVSTVQTLVSETQTALDEAEKILTRDDV